MAACCVAILAALCIAKGGSLNLYSGTSALVRTLSEFSLGSLLYRAYSDHTGFPRAWAIILAVLFVGLATITHLDFLFVGAFTGLIYYGVNAKDAFGKLLLPGLGSSRQLVVFNLSVAGADALCRHGYICGEWFSR